MSQSTKRKYVTQEVLDTLDPPKENQKIVKIVAGKGNNLHQVIEADLATTYLVSMPNKFRKNVWVKRGDFCIIEAIEEGDKVRGEIVRILYKDQIRYFKSEKIWPFQEDEETSSVPLPDSEGDDDSDMFQNPNRPAAIESDSSTEEDSESEEEKIE